MNKNALLRFFLGQIPLWKRRTLWFHKDFAEMQQLFRKQIFLKLCKSVSSTGILLWVGLQFCQLYFHCIMMWTTAPKKVKRLRIYSENPQNKRDWANGIRGQESWSPEQFGGRIRGHKNKRGLKKNALQTLMRVRADFKAWLMVCFS